MVREVRLGVLELAHGDPLGLHLIEKGMSEQNKRDRAKAAEQQHLDDLLTALQDSSTKLASDGADLITKRN
jgi:hypothetical protein